MGYAGYVPAKLPPSRKSPLQQALADIACMESLDVIGKLLYNTAVSPKEEKYRRIRLTNPKINKALVETPGSKQAMVLFGWEPEGEEYLVLTKNITMAEVRMVEDAKDELKKSLRTTARTALSRAQASAETLPAIVTEAS